MIFSPDCSSQLSKEKSQGMKTKVHGRFTIKIRYKTSLRQGAMKNLNHVRKIRRLMTAIAFLTTFSVTVNPGAIAQETARTTPVNSDTNPAATAIAKLRKTSDRWIEVQLENQRLVAWEGNKPVYAIIVSTGTDTYPTRPGIFAIQTKHEVARMQGADYDIPDVPFTMYYDNSYAIHGAYWNRRFGTPVSHGCVNVAVNHAEWLFNWAAVGTPVIVHDGD
jgi:lipoprotein-anchoring transpeptidase ErfK/SrfK